MGVKLMAVIFATLMTATQVSANLVMEWNLSPIAETKACQMRVQMIALHAVLAPTLIDQLATEEETVTFRNKIIQN